MSCLVYTDIDFNEGCLYVRRSVGRIGKFGVVVSEPKTKRSRRKITLPAFVIDALKHHQERQQAMREKAGTQWRNKDIVFCNMYGDYLSTTNLQIAFKRLLQTAELPDIRFHDLRHSVATIMLGMGVHPKIVQELLGHSNISITMGVLCRHL